MSQTNYYTSIITAFRKSLQQLSCLDSHKISTMAIERIGRQFRDTQGTYTVHYLGKHVHTTRKYEAQRIAAL
jgi:hypothetical protein